MANSDDNRERGDIPERTGELYDSYDKGKAADSNRQPQGDQFALDEYGLGQDEGNSAGYSGMYGGAQYGQAPYEAPPVPSAGYAVEKAGAEAWRFPGPFTGRGPRNYKRSDERIREDICDRLTQAGQIDASDIEVKVSDAEVTLAGQVDSRQAKHMAEDIAEGVPGVRDVHNQINVREGPVDTANDELTPGSREH